MDMNPSAVPLFLMSLFILGLIGLEIYNDRISISRSIRPHPDWNRKSLFHEVHEGLQSRLSIMRTEDEFDESQRGCVRLSESFASSRSV